MREDLYVRASDLCLQKEIAQRLGMNPQKVANLAAGRRHSDDFPRPVSGVGNTGIWLWSQVEAWWYEQYIKPTNTKKRAA